MSAERHVLSILVENRFGELARIVGLFSGRGFNIDKITASPTLDPRYSRVILVTRGDDAIIEQITKQKLPDGFQTAEFFLDHGMIDLIVDRATLRRRLADLLDHYARARQVDRGESIPWIPNANGSGRELNGNGAERQNGVAQ